MSKEKLTTGQKIFNAVVGFDYHFVPKKPLTEHEYKIDEQIENEVNQDLLDNHDCHNSPEDGCDCNALSERY